MSDKTYIYEKVKEGYYILWEAEGGFGKGCSPTFTRSEYAYKSIEQVHKYIPNAISMEEFGDFFTEDNLIKKKYKK